MRYEVIVCDECEPGDIVDEDALGLALHARRAVIGSLRAIARDWTVDSDCALCAEHRITRELPQIE